MAEKLSVGALPIEHQHFTDGRRFEAQILRNQTGYIHARYEILCRDYGIEVRDQFAKNAGRELQLWQQSTEYVLAVIWEGSGIISYRQLKELLEGTKYAYKGKSPQAIQKQLRDWVYEADVPPIWDIDFTAQNLGELELLSFARLGAIDGLPLSKKTLRKRSKNDKKSELSGEFAESCRASVAKYLEKYKYCKMLLAKARTKSANAPLLRFSTKNPPEIMCVARYSSGQHIDYIANFDSV